MDIKKYLKKTSSINDDIDIEKLTNDLRKGVCSRKRSQTD